MKKILVVMMMCLMSAVTFGESKLSNKGCVATLTRYYFSGKHLIGVALVKAYGSTCAEAMGRAEAILPSVALAEDTPMLTEDAKKEGSITEELVENP